MGHTHTLTAKLVDFAPMAIGVKEAREILAKVPAKALRGLNYGLVAEIRRDLLSGRWPTEHIVSFEKDGTLFRGLNLIYAISTTPELKNPVMAMVIIPSVKNHASARQKAILAKAPRYFTGKPCKHGHVVERLTSCGRCISCHQLKKQRRDRELRKAKKFRIKKYGFDPLDLRAKRKERGIKLSDDSKLVRLREKRKLLGRKDRPLSAPAEAPQDKETHT